MCRGGDPLPLIRGIYESTRTKADVATVGTGSEAPIAFDKRVYMELWSPP